MRSPSPLPVDQPPQVSIVVPTYREVDSLPHLIERIAQLRAQQGLDVELLIVDDDSRDGSAELLAARPESWLRLIVRRDQRGLSSAVLAGLAAARGEVLVCMDADLSHPPECVPLMLARLRGGADFVVGSRYVAGGSTADNWGALRWLNSRVATVLARPFTRIRDPMSGFFALTRGTYERGRDFNPVGYKVGLELIVKCHCDRVVEVPIHFAQRRFGHSKLTFSEQLRYLRHLRRLYVYRYGLLSELVQFLLVGGIGTVVNLAALTLMLALGVPVRAAVALAIWIAMSGNFVLNRRFSFAVARRGSWWTQYLRFAAASALAGVVSYGLTVYLLDRLPALFPQVAALLGIVAGTGINFLASRYLIFGAARWPRYRPWTRWLARVVTGPFSRSL